MSNKQQPKTTSPIPLISVIVPVYKTEKYLEKCLSSIAAQTFQDFEVLCVNDQSPDGSAKILEAYAAKDNRFKNILHEQNLGLGGARNTALRLAKANYIASVDSDDYIEPEMLERAYIATENETQDIVCFGYNKVNDEGSIISRSGFKPRIKILEDNNNIFRTFNPAFWNKLWRKSLYLDNEIFFPLHLYSEDIATSPRILTKAKSVSFIAENLYNYLIRDDSISFQMGAKNLIDYIKVFDILHEFLKKEDLWEDYKSRFTSDLVMHHLRVHSKNMMKSNLSEKEKTDYLRHILLLRESYIQSNHLLASLDQSQLVYLIESKALVETEEAVKIKTEQMLNSIRNNLRFQAAQVIEKGFSKPGMNTVLMPWRLFNLVLNWLNRKRCFIFQSSTAVVAQCLSACVPGQWL